MTPGSSVIISVSKPAADIFGALRVSGDSIGVAGVFWPINIIANLRIFRFVFDTAN